MTTTVSVRATALICPGQGSQHARMLAAVPNTATLDRLLDAAEAMTDIDLRGLDRVAEASALADTRVAQPLLYLADWAWGSALLGVGLQPVAVAGHSLGEFAALALAGVFSVEAGLQLVCERASLMAQSADLHPGGMAAVIGLSATAIADALDAVDGVWVANDNCPGQLVISGTTEGIDAATSVLSDAGARRVIPLAVAGGFHSPLMQHAADAFREILEQTDFSDASIPVVQNTAPRIPVSDAQAIRSQLAEQMTSPVEWTETVATLRSLGAHVLVETGPGTVLSGLARRVEGVEAIAVEEGGVEAVMEEVRT